MEILTYFDKRCNELLADKREEYFTVSKDIAFRGVTINTLYTDIESFRNNPPFDIEKNSFAKESFTVLDQDVRLGINPLHHAGVYYVQEPSATSAPEVLDVKEGDIVLDMCAAPGGKSSRLSAALNRKGLLVTNEYVRSRAQILLGNMERMGIENAVVLNEKTENLPRVFSEFFDKILIDAPCSGEGMFRKEPQAITQHSETLVKSCASLQQEILENGAKCLKENGVIVYSTCTFSPDENEGNIGKFLSNHPEFILEDCEVSFGCFGHENHCINGLIDVEKVRRIYPCHGGEGHFVAKLRKTSSTNTSKKQVQMKTSTPPKEYTDFIKKNFNDLSDRKVYVKNNEVYILPQFIPIEMKKLNILRCGVFAGTVEKNRFEPHHHLYSALGHLSKNKLDLKTGDTRINEYLKGEEIEASECDNGFCAVLLNGVPLSFGKVSSGKLKNRYPKGLRNFK